MTHLLAKLGWVDFVWDVSPSFPAAQQLLPNSHQPRQNRADSGRVKIKVNPTQVRHVMGHPVSIPNLNQAQSADYHFPVLLAQQPDNLLSG